MGAPGILGKCDEIFRKAAERAAAETHRDVIPGLMVRFCDLAATEYRRSWDEHYLKLREMYIKEHLEHIEKNLAPLCRDLRTLLIKEEIMAPPDHPLDQVGKWVWITIRPEQGVVSLMTFVSDVTKLAAKNLFTEGSWVYEQVGKTAEEAGDGFHVHMLMKVKDYVQVKDILNAVKFISYKCQTQIGEKDKNKKFVWKQKDLDFLQNYMAGDKHNKAKDAAVAIDAMWREANQLKRGEKSATIKTGSVAANSDL